MRDRHRLRHRRFTSVGVVVEVYGPESSGKTTLTLQAIAEAQKEG